MNDHNRLVEQEGIYFVGSLAAKLGYLFRQVREHDKGIDADIEITQLLGVPSNIIGVQIKSRSSFRITSEKKISITVTQQNLEYWKSYGHPVILMAYSNEEVYWTRVDNIYEKTIKIDLTQMFDCYTISQFTQLIFDYYSNMAWNLDIQGVSEILLELGSTIGEALKPIEKNLNDANNLMLNENYKEAARIYKSLNEIYKNNNSLKYNWGVCLLKSGKCNKGIKIAKELLKKSPYRSDYYNLIGIGFSLTSKYEEAESAFVEAIRCKFTSYEAWTNLGILHWQQERNLEAYDDLKVASIYAPSNDTVHFNLALISIALENYEQALHHYDLCIKLKPNHYDAFNNKGILLYCLFRFREALDSYESAIKIDSKNVCALCNSASILKDLGYNDRAIQQYHMVLEKRPDKGEIHFNLGVLYCRIGNLQTAAYHLDKSYNLLKKEKSSKGVTILVDIGYEVCYLIAIYFTHSSVKILSVKPIQEMALLNVPIMRERLKYSHIINEPLVPGQPQEFFHPNKSPIFTQ